MRIKFNADLCSENDSTKPTKAHVLSQFNVSYDQTLNIFSLFENDESPFRVDLDTLELEELMRFYEIFSSCCGEREISRRAAAVAEGKNQLASLALKRDDNLSEFFHALTKLMKLIFFLQTHDELENAGFYRKDSRDYIRLLNALPDPPKHQETRQRQQRQEISRDLVHVNGETLLRKQLTVENVLEQDQVRLADNPQQQRKQRRKLS